MLKIRKDKLGIKTSSKTIAGMVTVTEDLAEMFAKEGRFDLLEIPESLELKPLSEIEKSEPVKKEKPAKEKKKPSK